MFKVTNCYLERKQGIQSEISPIRIYQAGALHARDRIEERYEIKYQQYYKEVGMRRDGEEMLRARSTDLQIRIAKECCLLYDGAERG